MDHPRELDALDETLRPYLPHIGSIAVESARIEFCLAGLLMMLTDRSVDDGLRMRSLEVSKLIREALAFASGSERAAEAIRWTETADRLLGERGDLMHSLWIVGSGLVRDADGFAAADRSSQSTDRRIHSMRLRRGEQPQPRSVDDLANLALDLHEHVLGWLSAYLAVAILKGYLPRDA